MSGLQDQPAPDFELADQDGETFRLSDQAGQRLLLVFYPGDGTPVCTRQLCEYQEGLEAFAGLGVRLVGISPDDAESHQRFRARHGLDFTLLCDPDLAAAERYGCRGWAGMKRGVFLIDEEQVVRYAHVEVVAAFKRSRAELEAAIRELQS